ncbi:MAG: hypothetical protein ACRDRG_18140 [Pseudonocardiaceae bacterium]
MLIPPARDRSASPTTDVGRASALGDRYDVRGAVVSMTVIAAVPGSGTARW